MVSALNRIGKLIFLEEQETQALGSTWRLAELAGGKAERMLLGDVVEAQMTSDTGFRDQYLNQGPMTSKLEHPNILRKHTTLHEGGELIAVYEYQEGFSLEKVMKRCQQEMNPFSVDHALLVVSKLLSALSYAKTKHFNHGFVNPSKIFVTHEGEIKLRGFAFSAALRSAQTAPPMSDYYRNYVPAGMSLVDEDRARLDIYGCGAILYEMLIGSVYQGTNAASVVGGARMAADGEPVPEKIAQILIKSLDPNQPGAYKDIQRMAKDMDELLFSGEYSPTTFNLAFFMHSAFRLEMEELGEKIAKEKETNFDKTAAPAPAAGPPKGSAPPPPRAAAAAAPPPPRKAEPAPAAAPVQSQVVPEKGKSKGPLIGIIAAVVILGAVGVFMATRGGGEAEQKSDFDNIADQLAKEGEVSAEERRQQEIEELRLRNEQLQAVYEEQMRAQRERQKQELEQQMKDLDKQIAEVKAREQAEKQREELAREMEELRKLKDDLKKQQEVAAAKAKAAEDAAKKPVEKPAADTTDTKTVAANNTNTAKPANPEPKKEADASAATAPAEPPKPTTKMPQKGELVDLSDELLRRPNFLTVIPTLKVPRKAIRSGAVKRDTTVYFMMKALVDEEGRVQDVTLFRSPLKPGSDDYGMIDSAIETVKKQKFTKPTKMGVPVKVWMYVPVNFLAR